MTVEEIMNRILKKIRTGILAAGFISVSALAMAQNVLSVPDWELYRFHMICSWWMEKAVRWKKCLLRTRSV